MSKPIKRLVIVDVSNFIFRAFFAIRSLNAPDGTPVNALYGVLTMLLNLISKYQPTHVLMARDTSSGSFRNKMYSEYKANRTAPPEELIPQFALIETLLNKMGLPHISHDDYEADDIIGSAAIQWKNDFDEILIASGDKDLMQLIGDNIKMVDTMKDKIYDSKGVFEKMGVWPKQIVDYLCMVGDSSDNIPGMRGIGAKGAAKLLAEYEDFDSCVAAKDKLKGKKLTTAFSDHLEDAYLSKKLLKIVTDMELGLSADSAEYKFWPSDDLIEWLREIGFKSQVRKLEEIKKIAVQADTNKNEVDEFLSNINIADPGSKLECVQVYDGDIEFLKKEISAVSTLSFLSFYDSDHLLSSEMTSLALSLDGVKSYYLDFAVLGSEIKKSILEVIWGNEALEVSGVDLKADFVYALRKKITFKASRLDITQVHFVLSPGSNHKLESLTMKELGYEVPPFEKGEKTINDLANEQACAFAGKRASACFSLAHSFKSQLKAKDLESIYYEMDDLLIPALSRMEMAGISVNTDYFKELERELQSKLNIIEEKVAPYFDDEAVNLNSPKQVAHLLFEKLNLPTVKKTKTGQSTDSEVLVELDSLNLSPVPGFILQYREIGKILSTYVKALPELVNPISKRLHTTFTQYVAATGRLSSINPNLQNIPIRSELGRKVRKGFIASPGSLLLGADYSQVELRLLAHFSGDKTMLEAFAKGHDIHSQTASEILGIALSEVTSDERSKAKAVNFGLMYGQSSFGLAKNLRITRSEAKDYITKYFQRFNRVKGYLDSLKEECERTGYSQTLFGRKRFLPDIYSKNRTVKAMAERLAVNSPIQGTAADIIKKAMIDIDQKISEKGLQSQMILQVHDELIFEVQESELEVMKQIVRHGMEHVVELSVPLKVDMGVGVNWFDLK